MQYNCHDSKPFVICFQNSIDSDEAPRSLELFNLWKVAQLTTFLKARGIKTSRRSKAELVALAFAAEDCSLPVVGTDDNERKKAELYTELLTDSGVKLPDPFHLQGWEEEKTGVHKWPPIMSVDIATYICRLNTNDFTKRLLSDYKEGKAYSYFESGWISNVTYHKISDTSTFCFLKASCTPSQKIKQVAHRAWILVEKATGSIKSAYCTCFAG